MDAFIHSFVAFAFTAVENETTVVCGAHLGRSIVPAGKIGDRVNIMLHGWVGRGWRIHMHIQSSSNRTLHTPSPESSVASVLSVLAPSYTCNEAASQ